MRLDATSVGFVSKRRHRSARAPIGLGRLGEHVHTEYQHKDDGSHRDRGLRIMARALSAIG